MQAVLFSVAKLCFCVPDPPGSSAVCSLGRLESRLPGAQRHDGCVHVLWDVQHIVCDELP